MRFNDLFELLAFLIALIGLGIPLGRYMAAVFEGRTPRFAQGLQTLERFFYRAGGLDPTASMTWKTYAGSVIVFHVLPRIRLRRVHQS